MSSIAHQGQLESTISETTPLLESLTNDYDAIPHYESQKPAIKAIYQPTPLPRTQLGSLCIIRLAEYLSLTLRHLTCRRIFPYVNEQIRILNICDPNSVGVYSGIIESSFAIAQLFSVMGWAKLSDQIGRRPVIFAGTIGVMFTTLMFGVSQSFWMLVLSRALAGIFCGNVAVIQSVLGEITDSTNQAIAFPLFAIPLIGGTFSNPAQKFTLLNVNFLRQYPYFLPCFIAACISLIGLGFGSYFLEETLPSKVKQLRRTKLSRTNSDDTLVECTGIGGEEVCGPPPSSAGIKALLQIPVIRALECIGVVLAMPDSQIGYTLAIAGCIASAIQLFLMPTLLRRFEPGKMYATCICVFPLAFLMMPLLNYYAFIAGPSANSNALIWVGIALTMLFSRIGNVAYALSMVLVKQHSPNQSTLGSVNGLVQWSMCLARAFAPAVASSMFALCQDYPVMGGYFWALAFACLSLCAGLTFTGSIA
ncbi:MFS general substrate transporter [Flagelloscypha sp. PMI_526]|nr:MFS general substrate transporter [Flagelloscypha sp. PMI_526]